MARGKIDTDKRQDIKAGMGHSPDKLHEYPQVLGEIVEAMGVRA